MKRRRKEGGIKEFRRGKEKIIREMVNWKGKGMLDKGKEIGKKDWEVIWRLEDNELKKIWKSRSRFDERKNGWCEGRWEECEKRILDERIGCLKSCEEILKGIEKKLRSNKIWKRRRWKRIIGEIWKKKS